MIQAFYNLLLKTLNGSLGSKIIKFIVRVVEKWILKFGVPIVRYKLAGIEIRIPWTHDLPFILKHFPNYSSNIGKIGKYAKEKFDDLTLIDVGGNVGDTVIIARKYAYYPILSIEGDKYYFSLLKKNLASQNDVTLVNAFVSAANEVKRGSLHRYAGSLRVEPNPRESGRIEFKTLPQILQEHPRFSRSKLLKIDTDGFDLMILRGAVDFLQSARAILFFEYDPSFLALQCDNGVSIFPLLQSLGYDGLVVYDNYGDYLLSTSVNDLDLLADLHHYFSTTKKYCDLCVFHSEDADLFATVRTKERNR